jgi:hypothetical protein
MSCLTITPDPETAAAIEALRDLCAMRDGSADLPEGFAMTDTGL